MTDNQQGDRILSGKLIRYEAPYPEDEISLIDMWIILIRHKWLAFGIASLVIGSALIYAFMMTPEYKYTTSLQIAKLDSGPIESPATVVAKLENSYIPHALQEFENSDFESEGINFKVTVPKDSLIVVLESIGKETELDHHSQLHTAVLNQVIEDHRMDLEDKRQELQAELGQLRVQITSSKDEASVLKEREIRLLQQEELLHSQLENIDELAGNAEKVRQKLLAEQNGEAGAVDLMFINNEISRLRERQASLDEELFIGLNTQKNELQGNMLANKRLQMELNEKVNEITMKLDTIPSTRITTSTMQSLHPVNVGMNTIVMLAIVMGLLLGIFSAFIVEFISRANKKMHMESGQ